jgi:hypothetical protein
MRFIKDDAVSQPASGLGVQKANARFIQWEFFTIALEG